MQPKSALSPTPYPDLNRVLAEFVSRVQAVLGDRFTAAYLVGSFAIGDFDTHSDVDFLIAMEEEVAEHRLPELQKMHGRIHELDSPWSRHLDGSYIPLNVLRKHDPTNTPTLS